VAFIAGKFLDIFAAKSQKFLEDREARQKTSLICFENLNEINQSVEKFSIKIFSMNRECIPQIQFS
jgi:hypothetical protein